MSVVIPDEIVQATGMSPDELMQEIAVYLFQRERLTLEQASRFAGLDRISFQRILSSRDIPIHYDIADFEADLDTLRRLNRI